MHLDLNPKQYTWGFVIVAVIVLLFFLHYLGALWPIENLVAKVFHPVQRLAYQASGAISHRLEQQQERTALEAEVERLTYELRQQIIARSQQQLAEEENRFLRQQLNFVKQESACPILANVISQTTESVVNTLTIDQGGQAGIVSGSPVVVEDKIIVGKISKVNDFSSVVLLINDHSSQLAASVLNMDKTIGVVRGEYGLGIKMELIPQTERVEDGDVIVTSGIEDYIPRGLVIGTVDNVSGSQEDLFQQAVIKLPVNFNKIYQVNVLTPLDYGQTDN